MKNFLVFLIFISLLACNQRDHSSTKTAITVDDSVKNETIIPTDTLSNALFPGKDTLIIKLEMDTGHITIPIKISSGKELFVSLFSDDKKANIRISQVEFPDSTFDGPFGRELRHKITTPGNYKLIIGEDMMAGNRWKGDFVLKVYVH